VLRLSVATWPTHRKREPASVGRSSTRVLLTLAPDAWVEHPQPDGERAEKCGNRDRPTERPPWQLPRDADGEPRGPARAASTRRTGHAQRSAPRSSGRCLAWCWFLVLVGMPRFRLAERVRVRNLVLWCCKAEAPRSLPEDGEDQIDDEHGHKERDCGRRQPIGQPLTAGGHVDSEGSGLRLRRERNAGQPLRGPSESARPKSANRQNASGERSNPRHGRLRARRREVIATYIAHYHDRPHSRLDYRTPRDTRFASQTA